MIPKNAFITAIYSILLGVCVLFVSILSQGQYFNKVIPLIVAIFAAGFIGSISLIIKGRKADQECDERENHITEKSMKFTFYVMSFVLTSYWAHDVVNSGIKSTFSFYILMSFWLTFLLSYGVNKFRF